MTCTHVRRLGAGLVFSLLAAAVTAQSTPPGIRWQTVATGLVDASAMAFAPDGRLFVTERLNGRIRVVENGALRTAPWATVPAGGGANFENGLLGIAVDPDFPRSRHVYVLYTTGMECVIARLQDVAGTGQNLTVLTAPGALPAHFNHNSGRMLFGQDGMLYVATGDRIDSNTSQDLQSWNGKILRLAPPNLTIPGDNPFPGSAVWSYGHRNHYGLAVEPRSGALFQGENGWQGSDELNRIVRGGNFGWPIHEGLELVPDPNAVDPLAVWPPGSVPVGSTFLQGELWPAQYRGDWFVVRWAANELWQVSLDPSATSIVAQSLFADLPGQGYDVAMGPDGNLWYLADPIGGSRGASEVGRFVPTAAPNPSAHLMAVANQAVGGSVTFGFTGEDGDLVVSWLSTTRWPRALPTPYGDQWVPADAVLPVVLITGDRRGYLAVSVAANPSLVGTRVSSQAVRVPPSLQIRASNAVTLELR